MKRLPHLKEIDFQQAKELAKAMSRASFKDISVGTDIPASTLQRMFTDPDYHPGAPNIPLLCKALGNTILVDWMAEQIGGYVVLRCEEKPSEESIQKQMASLLKEMGEAMTADAEARLDGTYTEAELSRTEQELQDVITAAEKAKSQVKKLRIEMKLRRGGDV